MEILVKKDEKITSSKSSKILLCYNVMSVYVGQVVIRYDYSFWDSEKKKAKTIKHSELKKMLNGVWNIKK